MTTSYIISSLLLIISFVLISGSLIEITRRFREECEKNEEIQLEGNCKEDS